MTLCVTGRFYILKDRHFAKSNTICVTFLCLKIRTLCITRFFIEVLKLAEGGGPLLRAKNNALRVTFLYLKKCTLGYVLYTKIPTLYVTLLYAKNDALSVTSIYLKCIVHSSHT